MTAIERAPHVLRVDDEISILTFAKRALSDAGYEVVVASDGPTSTSDCGSARSIRSVRD
jgi:DNA-binding response OmpR family regulator